MICRVGADVYVGRAIDLSVDGDPTAVAEAVRTGRATVDGTEIEVCAREAGDLHERVGCVTADVAIRPRTALAVAARSRGWSTPVDDDLAAARERLAGCAVADDAPDTAGHRRDLVDASADVDRLRERAAEARGRIQATASDGDAADGADGGTDLETVVRELSEAETRVAAARERHRDARQAARRTRDRLQEYLRHRDEVANLAREARARLVERARRPYEAALATVPGVSRPSDPFEAPPDAMALAIARLGDVGAPIVCACERFECAESAARWLGEPVLRL